jgi:UDP-N-acetylmuramyl pentapeptide phosphotransferase/UDP-N-acetylglucosamine-1-phosphate transferase
MDGLDAVASVTCAVAFGLALGVASGAADPGALSVWGAALGAVLGFLFWNAPPSRIFMGDGGSHALGFLVAATVCRGGPTEPLGDALRPVPWALLGGALVPSIVDVGEALLHKGRHGIPMSLAHNDHLYQRLVKSGLTHGAVALRYGALAVTGAAVAGPLASAYGLVVALPVGLALLGAHLADGARRTRRIPRLEAP